MHFDTRHFVYLNTLATLVYAVSRNYKILFLMSNTRDCYQQCTQYEGNLCNYNYIQILNILQCKSKQYDHHKTKGGHLCSQLFLNHLFKTLQNDLVKEEIFNSLPWTFHFS